MLAPVTHILPLTTIVRERLLPMPGTVHAQLNKRVSANDVVASAHWAREHILLDVARALGLAPSRADRLIRCKTGQELSANALVASTGGLFPQEVRTPRAGRVVVAGGGRVLLEVGEADLELRAGIAGLVVQVIPERGVAIQTTGALVQGVWGNGRIETGMMVNLMEKPDTVLEVGRLDVSLRGSVILGGMALASGALQAAAELPVRGLILSSMEPALIPLAAQMRYPIVVMDGFGQRPMNSAAYRLLSTNAKREVILNAENTDRYTGARPEVIIPLPISSEPPALEDVVPFAAGRQVKLRAGADFGAVATILRVHPGPMPLPSGLRAPAADIRLENGVEALVPLANLEVVG